MDRIRLPGIHAALELALSVPRHYRALRPRQGSGRNHQLHQRSGVQEDPGGHGRQDPERMARRTTAQDPGTTDRRRIPVGEPADSFQVRRGFWQAFKQYSLKAI